MSVHVDGHLRGRVPKTLAYGCYRNARTQQLCRREVSQVVEAALHTCSVGSAPPPLREDEGTQWPPSVHVVGEHVRLLSQGVAAGQSSLGDAQASSLQHRGRCGIERDRPARSFGLRRLDREIGVVRDRADNRKRTELEVHVSPLQAAELASSRAGHDCQVRDLAEVRVCLRRELEYLHQLIWLRKVRFRRLAARNLSMSRRIASEPPPSDRLLARSMDDRVRVADAVRGERSAALPSPLAQCPVELVEPMRRQPPQWKRAERRQEVLVDLGAVAKRGVRREVWRRMLPHCSISSPTVVAGAPGTPSFASCVTNSAQARIRFASRAVERSGQLAASAGQRISAGIDDQLPRAATPGADGPSHDWHRNRDLVIIL